MVAGIAFGALAGVLCGTLGFFGLGLSPESPDWGSTINFGRRLLTIAPHPLYRREGAPPTGLWVGAGVSRCPLTAG